MKQAKIIHLEENVILTLSIRALKKRKKFKGYVEELLTMVANTIERSNQKHEMESKNQLGKH